MQLTFLGVGGAFTTMEYFQSNLLVTAGDGGRLLLDCGGDIRHSLAASIPAGSARDVDAVYVSHLHADHVGGLEWLAFSRYFGGGGKPLLYLHPDLRRPLWQHCLSGGLAVVQGNKLCLDDYFDCRPVENTFNWHGLRCTVVRLPHVVGSAATLYSYGLMMESGGRNLFFSSDTAFCPGLLLPHWQAADLILQDCETSPSKTGVHCHYQDLLTLPASLRAKMWLYHYQPASGLDAVADGFAGFARRGQVIRL
ncbi:MAG: MBL fold metallo-hydrolase [Thermodesulfobacteriota bacterium]